MSIERSRPSLTKKRGTSIRRLHAILAPRAYTVIMFGALFCTLAAKFVHACRINLLNEYPGWILIDIAVLVGIEAVLASACFRWPRKRVIRAAMIIAAIVCTWSVMNAGWLARTGTQILPQVCLPLVRAPLTSFGIIGVNLAKMPITAVTLLMPSAIALAFFFSALANPKKPGYNRKRFLFRILVSVSVILIALLVILAVSPRRSVPIASIGLRYNCQLKAITSFFSPDSEKISRADLENPKREIPPFDKISISVSQKPINHNIVIVILEGVQYAHTSLADPKGNLTPFLLRLSQQGAEFTNTHSSLTHTTKAIFSLLTGRFPSASQDLAEAVPVEKPYAALPTILKEKLNFRTAFFQSAKGTFECRPGLIANLGFDKFAAREDLDDPNAFIGYLACDEFSMLKPITEWIKADDKPFLLTVLCSVTHDPYEVPGWYAEPADEPLDRYRQTIAYTDKFIAALDVELKKLNLADNTIFCVIGDHGEAFGEHSFSGHERIPFDEVLRIPFCLRAPFLVDPETKINKPVSSVDLTPTLLALLGFDTQTSGFDGLNALGTLPDKRKVYFSGWMQQSPAGFIKENFKFIYYPTTKIISVYDLSADPAELYPIEPSDQLQATWGQADKIADDIIVWRKNSIFKLKQTRDGKKTLFTHWPCRWTNRVPSAKRRK